MLCTFVRKDIDGGLQSYAEIRAENVWPRYSERFNLLTRAAYLILLLGRGDLNAVRRGLDENHEYINKPIHSAHQVQNHFTLIRLQLARGDIQLALDATRPDGPLGEDMIIEAGIRRYLPLSLMIRGTALIRTGEQALAEDCFFRATHSAVTNHEWYTLLAAETPEYRCWLETRDRDALPAGLDQQTYDAVLSKPLLVRANIPALTPRQMHILELLTQDRAIDSITQELYLSKNTMKSHLRRLYDRLGVSSREQAVLRAEQYGYLGRAASEGPEDTTHHAQHRQE